MTCKFSKAQFERRHLLAGGIGLLLPLKFNSVLAANAASGAMSRATFEDYINRFNKNDPTFVDFYHPDVVLELGTTAITSAQGIADFYAEVKQYIHEFLQLDWFISDENGVAVEMTTTFSCFNDWEDSFWNRPLQKGEVYRASGFVHYEIDQGYFKHIKSARYQVIDDWHMEDLSL